MAGNIAGAKVSTEALGLSGNERLILSQIRRNEVAAKAELARWSGLSPTAVGAIIGQLESRGLVTRGEPQKGKIGQPSVPYAIASDGAFGLGVKIGRRTTEMALLDARMQVVDLVEQVYAYPKVGPVLDFLGEAAKTLLRKPGRRVRLLGCAAAAPSEIWKWREVIGAPPGVLEAWRDLDLATKLTQRLGVPTATMNDATAACAAQAALHPETPGNMVYFFVGWFIGGGVLLNGRVLEGARGAAGALGSMPVAGPDGRSRQLIQTASLFRLERDLAARGVDLAALWKAGAEWRGFDAELDAWIETAAQDVAQAIAGASAIIDFDAAVIDGSFPAAVRQRFVAAVRDHHGRLDLQGLAPIGIEEGRLGRSARVIGAGCAPLLAALGAQEI